MTYCIGECVKHVPKDATGKKCYINGYRRCVHCNIFMKLPDGTIRCPCCNTKLRCMPRNRRWKKQARTILYG